MNFKQGIVDEMSECVSQTERTVGSWSRSFQIITGATVMTWKLSNNAVNGNIPDHNAPVQDIK